MATYESTYAESEYAASVYAGALLSQEGDPVVRGKSVPRTDAVNPGQVIVDIIVSGSQATTVETPYGSGEVSLGTTFVLDSNGNWIGGTLFYLSRADSWIN